MKQNGQSEYTPDNLVAGNFLALIEPVVVAADASLKRGSVLGKITDSGKYCLATAAADDGSETPAVILAEDIEAGENVEALVYTTGIFAIPSLTLGQGLTADTAKYMLHTRSIFLVDMV